MVRIIQNYALYEIIGEGAYGKVYRAINKNDDKEYAVKVIEVRRFKENKKLQECTVNEINILTNIEKHQHIIKYIDMLKTPNNFYFIYEYCNGGTLEGVLRKERIIPEKNALLIFKQLIDAFQVLNKYNIMHRDLKPDNIFFNNGVVKLGDFGFCKSLEKANMTKTMLGSPIYMAPQILRGEIYSTKADIWSLGVVLYEMLYGFCPFESTTIPKLIEVLKETELQFPNRAGESVSQQTKKLLKKLLTKDPTKRIQWMQLLRINITGEGKLVGNKQQRLSLVQDDLSTINQSISEVLTETVTPKSNYSQNNIGQQQAYPPSAQPPKPRQQPQQQQKKAQQQPVPMYQAGKKQNDVTSSGSTNYTDYSTHYNHSQNNVHAAVHQQGQSPTQGLFMKKKNNSDSGNNQNNQNLMASQGIGGQNQQNNHHLSTPALNHNSTLRRGSSNNGNSDLEYPKQPPTYQSRPVQYDSKPLTFQPKQQQSSTPVNANITLKRTILKEHGQATRGMHLAIDLIKSNDINCVLFVYLILRKAEQKLINLRDEVANSYDLKQLVACFNSQLKEISMQLNKYNMTQNLSNWKVLIKATGDFHRNFRAFYMMVVYLAGEIPRDDLTQYEMQMEVKNKLS